LEEEHGNKNFSLAQCRFCTPGLLCLLVLKERLVVFTMKSSKDKRDKDGGKS
jgi:hypothetical protein